MDVIIRNAKREDIPSVVDIQIDGWKTAYRGIIDEEYLKRLSKEEKIEKRQKDFDKNGFIVAEENKKIVGFCRYIDSNNFSKQFAEIDCELLALYVKSDLKQKGIGKKLFKYVINEFKSKNKTKMILWCLKDNESAKKFYVKMGGILKKEKNIEIGNKIYKEVGFIYNL